MAGERLRRILDELSAGDQRLPRAARLCEVGAHVIGITGTGVMLMSGKTAQGSLCSMDQVSNLIEELQYTLGEGPCVDAYRDDEVVLEPDLADPVIPRWLAFTPPAVEAGARGVFGFPLRVGTVRLGALNLYRDRPGPLSDGQHADALVMAGVAARWVLDVQAVAPQGGLARELELGADFRLLVHDAAGMMAVQLGVSVGEALLHLRADAFSNDRPLNDVAQDVVDRGLRFS